MNAVNNKSFMVVDMLKLLDEALLVLVNVLMRETKVLPEVFKSSPK